MAPVLHTAFLTSLCCILTTPSVYAHCAPLDPRADAIIECKVQRIYARDLGWGAQSPQDHAPRKQYALVVTVTKTNTSLIDLGGPLFLETPEPRHAGHTARLAGVRSGDTATLHLKRMDDGHWRIIAHNRWAIDGVPTAEPFQLFIRTGEDDDEAPSTQAAVAPEPESINPEKLDEQSVKLLLQKLTDAVQHNDRKLLHALVRRDSKPRARAFEVLEAASDLLATRARAEAALKQKFGDRANPAIPYLSRFNAYLWKRTFDNPQIRIEEPSAQFASISTDHGLNAIYIGRHKGDWRIDLSNWWGASDSEEMLRLCDRLIRDYRCRTHALETALEKLPQLESPKAFLDQIGRFDQVK